MHIKALVVLQLFLHIHIHAALGEGQIQFLSQLIELCPALLIESHDLIFIQSYRCDTGSGRIQGIALVQAQVLLYGLFLAVLFQRYRTLDTQYPHGNSCQSGFS